jgi:hypothetical protein
VSPELDARYLAECWSAALSRPLPAIARTGFDPGRSKVIVGTEEFPEGEPVVAIHQLQRGLDILAEKGPVRIEPETFGGYRRSSFVESALATMHAD